MLKTFIYLRILKQISKLLLPAIMLNLSEQQMSHDIMFQMPSLIQLSAVAIPILLLLCFILKQKWSSITKNLPPSPPKLPILGNLHQLGSLPHHDLHILSQKHGPLMLLHFGSKPVLIASSADMARQIMKTHDIIFSERPDLSIIRRLLYNYKDISGAPYGEYWRQLKSICVLQLLSNKRVQSFHSIRAEETSLLMDRIRTSKNSVNLSEMFKEVTNDIVCRSAFGKKYREGEFGRKFIAEMLPEFIDLLGAISIGEFIPWLWWINRVNGFDARVDKVAKEIDVFLEGVIREQMETPAEQAVIEKGNKNNFLDILLNIYQNNTTGVSIDRDSIKAILLDVFAAGTDTTSTVLEWAMTEIMRNPSIMKKLQLEVREIVKDGHEITPDDLEKMHFLKAVIKETLRYHTPIPLLVPRMAREDVKVQGYNISAGTMVMINAWAIGRDPACWNEPEEFRPERFLNSSIDFMGLDFGLIPFGGGRRICPGISFAMATNEFVLANILHKFDWELPLGAKGKDLDMSELPGFATHRAVPLHAVATKCYY